MPLKIQLRRFRDYDDSRKRGETFRKRSEEVWGFGGRPYEEVTEVEKMLAEEQSRATAEELGLGEYGQEWDEEVRYDSTRHPDHAFKLGRFASDYGPQGVNATLRDMGVGDLGHIFGVEGKPQEYHVLPDWDASLDRARQILREVEEASSSEYRTVFSSSREGKCTSERQALDMVRREALRRKDPSHTRDEGYLWEDGLEVVGAIQGVNGDGAEGLYLVAKQNGGEAARIKEGLEVVVETIEWVLSQAHPEQYRLAWSE